MHEHTADEPKLSRQELRLLRLMASGANQGEAATFFKITTYTVRSRRRRMLKKLEARNTAHAVALGYEWHLLRTDPGHPGPSLQTTLGQVAQMMSGRHRS